MRDEPKVNQPRQLVMPLISTPSQTSHPHRVDSGKAPAITAPSVEQNITDFILGIDTCGFTSGSTITCSFGYECTNIGNYRGCCLAGAADCTSTIQTTCLDYGVIEDPAQCGSHTLCCPVAKSHCFSYGFLTSDQPGQTFTYVECQPTHGFGEMYPYPPELMSTTSAEPMPSSNASLVIEPSDGDDNDNNNNASPVPIGAIIGAVVGAIILVCLVALAAFLIIRRRRQQQQRRHIPGAIGGGGGGAGGGMVASLGDDDGGTNKGHRDGGGEDHIPAFPNPERSRTRRGGGRMRPLSTIHEQHLHHTPTTTSKSKSKTSSNSNPNSTSPLKRKSLTPAIARQSLGPDWPLAANHGNPLGAHPVDIEKRLSGTGIPILKVPAPPPAPPPSGGARLVPPPLLSLAAASSLSLPSSRKSSAGESAMAERGMGVGGGGGLGGLGGPGGSSSTSVAGLQSPRLSYVPVSPIDAAFRDEVDRRVGRLERDERTGQLATTTVARGGLGAEEVSDDDEEGEKRGRGSGRGRRRSSIVDFGTPFATPVGTGLGSAAAAAAGRESPEPVSPVSPLEREEEEEEEHESGTQRLSFVSAPSAPGEGDQELDDLVSPVSPERAGSGLDGRVSPESVSPLESRRGSLDR
ncbi:hypothetical protein F4778DRAFT_205130 [Xylariomycetidae sp. FL2044]|nr:hypothetical protein F4778DRAFT_205130 [Xylariomycetidae sp. FL2044]